MVYRVNGQVLITVKNMMVVLSMGCNEMVLYSDCKTEEDNTRRHAAYP